MGDFIGGILIGFIALMFMIGSVVTGKHYEGKWECEQDYNVSHCERNLTYTPTYPEVTNDK